MYKIRKNKFPALLFISFILFILCFCSCEKKEPEAQPVPNEIMKEILEKLSESETDCIEYISGQKDKELSEETAKKIYSSPDSDKDNKNNNLIDMSKIEKYSIRLRQSKENMPVEIGIFKLYDKTNAEYVKNMANSRIAKIREENKNNIDFLETANDAEARSYGNYVYYVSHSQKDRIFRIIENMLRNDSENKENTED